MYEALIREIMEERKPFTLERSAPEQETRDFHTSLFAEHVGSTLRPQLDEMRDRVEVSDAEDGGLWTEVQRRNQFSELMRAELDRPMQLREFTVPSGSRVFGPPYDEEWQTGGGAAFGARVDGQFMNISLSGESNAGVGFYLSSNEALSVAITPMGSYSFSQLGVGDQPSLQSRGGLGMAVYVNTEAQPAMSRQVTLWRRSGGAGVFFGDSGSGRLQDAESLPVGGGFGPVRLFPVYLDMHPGARYLVWVWSWQILLSEPPAGSDKTYIVFFSVKMPFVTVDAGSPIVIH